VDNKNMEQLWTSWLCVQITWYIKNSET